MSSLCVMIDCVQVLKAFMELGNPKNLIALDVDSSDNLTDDALHKFLSRHGHQLWGIALSGMPHITDQLWQSVLPVISNAKWVPVTSFQEHELYFWHCFCSILHVNWLWSQWCFLSLKVTGFGECDLHIYSLWTSLALWVSLSVSLPGNIYIEIYTNCQYSYTDRPWNCKHSAASKCHKLFTSQHGIASQKTEVFVRKRI